MKTTITTNYSLKEDDYSEYDRSVEEKELKAVTGDIKATVKVINDNTIEHSYSSVKNDKDLKSWLDNFDECSYIVEN